MAVCPPKSIFLLEIKRIFSLSVLDVLMKSHGLRDRGKTNITKLDSGVQYVRPTQNAMKTLISRREYKWMTVT